MEMLKHTVLAGLSRKKKCGVWWPHTFFYPKVHGFEEKNITNICLIYFVYFLQLKMFTTNCLKNTCEVYFLPKACNFR